MVGDGFVDDDQGCFGEDVVEYPATVLGAIIDDMS